MIPNQIDQFRNNFFAEFVRIEKEKELALKRKQRNCFHTFHVVDGNIECSKCELYKKFPADRAVHHAINHAVKYGCGQIWSIN